MNYSKKTLATVKALRLIDDTFFRLVAARIGVCQEILRTLLGDPALVVLEATPQVAITGLHREVIVDVLCKLGDGRIVNIEVQKGSQHDDIRRCRFHLSAITANKTPKGTAFADVPNVGILYITEYDALENRQAVTKVEMCQLVGGEYVPVNDGAVIYFANTAVDDGSEQAELLRHFLDQDAFDDGKFPEISGAVGFFKNNEKGVETMCSIVEEYAEERVKEAARDVAATIAVNLIKTGMSDVEISHMTGLPVEEIAELRD